MRAKLYGLWPAAIWRAACKKSQKSSPVFEYRLVGVKFSNTWYRRYIRNAVPPNAMIQSDHLTIFPDQEELVGTFSMYAYSALERLMDGWV